MVGTAVESIPADMNWMMAIWAVASWQAILLGLRESCALPRSIFVSSTLSICAANTFSAYVKGRPLLRGGLTLLPHRPCIVDLHLQSTAQFCRSKEFRIVYAMFWLEATESRGRGMSVAHVGHASRDKSNRRVTDSGPVYRHQAWAESFESEHSLASLE